MYTYPCLFNLKSAFPRRWPERHPSKIGTTLRIGSLVWLGGEMLYTLSAQCTAPRWRD